jgi:hypothetical protein
LAWTAAFANQKFFLRALLVQIILKWFRNWFVLFVTQFYLFAEDGNLVLDCGGDAFAISWKYKMNARIIKPLWDISMIIGDQQFQARLN